MDDRWSRRRILRVVGAIGAISSLRPATALAAGDTRKLGIFHWLNRHEWEQSRPGIFRVLAQKGWKLDRNLAIDWRAIRMDAADLDRVAASFAATRPDAILAESTPGTRALQHATRAIPIVTYVADPVLSGFAASLRRPGGNVTGLCDFDAESGSKAIELLKRLVPRLSHVAVFKPGALTTSREPADRYLAAAAKAGIEARLILFGRGNEIEAAVRGAVRSGSNGALAAGLLDDADFRELGESARRNKLPTLSLFEQFKDAFPVTLESYHRDWDGAFAIIVDKVLRGTPPGEIPFQQPDGLKVILNRPLAVDMGLAIPPDLEIRATEVIG